MRSIWRSLLILTLMICVPGPTTAASPGAGGAPWPGRQPAHGEPRKSPRLQATSFYIHLASVRKERVGLRIDPQDRAAVRAFYLEHYVASDAVNAAMAWTGHHGDCVPGTTSSPFRAAVVHRVNFFRAMAGVPADIVLSTEYNHFAQAAALIMSVNRNYSHNPPVDWRCYSTDGAFGAGRSNLWYGFAAPLDAVAAYMWDFGSHNYPVGHRRSILYPQTEMMGTGDVPRSNDGSALNANALWAWDDRYYSERPPTRNPYVAWPPPGYVPFQVVYPRWSFSYPGADFSTAMVAMNSAGQAIDTRLEPVKDGFGDNTLVWIPSGLASESRWPAPAADATYDVQIRHVRVENQWVDFSYTVVVFVP